MDGILRYRDKVRYWALQFQHSIPGMTLEDLQQEVWARLCIKHNRGLLHSYNVDRVIRNTLIDVWRNGRRTRNKFPGDLLVYQSQLVDDVNDLVGWDADYDAVVYVNEVLDRLDIIICLEEETILGGMIMGYSLREVVRKNPDVWLNRTTENSRYLKAVDMRRSLREKARRILDEDSGG